MHLNATGTPVKVFNVVDMNGRIVDVVRETATMNSSRRAPMSLTTGAQIDAAAHARMIEHPVEAAVEVGMTKERAITPGPLRRTIGLGTIDFSLLIATEATKIEREGDMDFIRVGCINGLERIDGVEAERRRHRRAILPLKAESR